MPLEGILQHFHLLSIRAVRLVFFGRPIVPQQPSELFGVWPGTPNPCLRVVVIGESFGVKSVKRERHALIAQIRQSSFKL
jgi:hypothetical protein